jgi:hypothetical protein
VGSCNMEEAAAERGDGGYVFSDQVGHLLRKAYHKHVAIFQEHSPEDSRVTAVQFATLCTLRDNGPSSQSDLVRATAIDQATIRGIINRLRTHGLVEPLDKGGDTVEHRGPQKDTDYREQD